MNVCHFCGTVLPEGEELENAKEAYRLHMEEEQKRKEEAQEAWDAFMPELRKKIEAIGFRVFVLALCVYAFGLVAGYDYADLIATALVNWGASEKVGSQVAAGACASLASFLIGCVVFLLLKIMWLMPLEKERKQKFCEQQSENAKLLGFMKEEEDEH